MSDSKTNESKVGRVLGWLTESAVVVALVSGVVALGLNWLSEDSWKKVGKFYMELAEQRCGD
ncbi:MAG: hypothetical protein OXR62_07025 [Ahrensia sp.]|nr:hypothetical protein [Ahrensia sp.]